MAETRSLDVRLHGELVGHLVESRHELRYRPLAARPILSVGSVSAEPWSPGFSRAWFEGLLPEGEMRARVGAHFRVEPGDTASLLEAIGWDCAGAVTVTPPSHLPVDEGYERLTDVEVGQRLDALPAHPYDADSALRSSLSGQQDKLLLARFEDAYHSAIGGAPTTHILKPEPDRWPGIARAEAWSLRLVAHATEAAQAIVETSLATRPTLVVTRYDREVREGRVLRIHQEDLCQAFGLLPIRKYSELPGHPDDPSYRRIAALLRAHAAGVETQLRTLLRQMVAHVVLMDADAHAKNLSLIHDERGYVRLSPVYDIVPTTAFLGSQKHLAMSINGAYRVDHIERSDLVAEARAWGYPATLATLDIDSAIAALDAGVADADAAFPDLDGRARLQVTGQLFRLSRSS